MQAPYDVISPDIASGMRFDVNRPFRAVGENPSDATDAAKIAARKFTNTINPDASISW